MALKFSVITVAYNSAHTLGATIKSVASQRYPNLEHIVVDGGSTDGTIDMLRENPGKVCRWVSEKDTGIYDAMNKGVSLATGDFVGWLNADDVYASTDAVTYIADAAETGSGSDVVYGDLEYRGAQDNERVIRTWRSGRFSPWKLLAGWMPPHPTFYVRRSLFLDLMGYDSSMRIAGDYEFMVRCLQRRGLRVTYVPQILVHMSWGGASNSSVKAIAMKMREDWTVIRRHKLAGPITLVGKNVSKFPQFFRRT